MGGRDAHLILGDLQPGRRDRHSPKGHMVFLRFGKRYERRRGSGTRGGETRDTRGLGRDPVTRKRKSRDGRVTGARRADPGEDALRREERRSPRGRPPGGTQQEGLG